VSGRKKGRKVGRKEERKEGKRNCKFQIMCGFVELRTFTHVE